MQNVMQRPQMVAPPPAMSLPTAPLLVRQPALPGDQVQRFGPTQTLHMVHFDSDLYGTGQVLGADTHLYTNSQRLNNDDLCSLKEAGKFSDWKQFVVYGIGQQCYFRALGTPGENEATAEELYDLFVYYTRIHILYQDANKQILWCDQMPAGGGVSGFTTTTDSFHLTNGQALGNSFFKLKESIVITPQKTFSFIRRFISTIFNVTGGPVAQEDPRTRFNSAINSQKLSRNYIHGIEARDISNG